MNRIYHVALPDDWERAVATGVYGVSTRGRSLDEEGFIHCSYRHQVEAIANRFYADVPDVILLEIDRSALNVPVIDESVDDIDEVGEQFPHVYGPLPLHAVVDTRPWERDADGRYTLADDDGA